MGTGIILAKNRDIAWVEFGDFSTFGDIGSIHFWSTKFLVDKIFGRQIFGRQIFGRHFVVKNNFWSTFSLIDKKFLVDFFSSH